MQDDSVLNSFSIESWNSCGWNPAIEEATAHNKYREIDILGITEMHLKDPSAVLTGRLLKTWGGPINDKAAGVGLSLSSRAQKALIFANAISPRILMARFKAKRADLTVIVVYIPHKGRYDTPINQSSTYNKLEQVIFTVSDHDCLIVMGDFNRSLACSDRTNNYIDKELIGRWSIHPNDDQGGALLRCIMGRQSLCAISTMFQYEHNMDQGQHEAIIDRSYIGWYSLEKLGTVM